ncbi:MAG: hypothetical protein M3P27_13105 [Acidobacteriota bacterium]|nr:hypothetical protein [Acidobacteriota bacterium]
MNRTAPIQSLPSRLAIVFLAAAVCVLPALAPADDGHAKRATETANARDAVADTQERQWAAEASDEKWERDPVTFSARERETIRIHYRAVAPGLPQRNDFPPGPPPGPASALRKPLQRNTVLPPRLQQRLQPLALDVERSLKVLPRGYSRGLLGQDVLLVENRTQRIIDIVRDVTGRH